MPLVCEVCGTVEHTDEAAEWAAIGDHLHVCSSCVSDRQPAIQAEMHGQED